MIQQELTTFFHHPVIILAPITLPSSFLNHSKGERYSADSIINYLVQKTSDSITQVLGFTHTDIFTTKRDRSGEIRQPVEKYAVWGIFGLGNCPGKTSIVSDYRLSTADTVKFRHRLRTVLLHEIGHNLGLPHCPNKGCMMNDANETITTIDKSGDNYCAECRRRLSL